MEELGVGLVVDDDDDDEQCLTPVCTVGLEGPPSIQRLLNLSSPAATPFLKARNSREESQK
jgi:hypothetical protein